jgi:predicted nucleic acid-binding protein
MNGIKFLLDTNIVIGLLKQGQAILPVEISNINICAISQITRMELLSFSRLTPEEESVIKKFISCVSVITLNEAIETATINFRRTQGGKLPDAVIIATALVHDLELVTLDSRMQAAYSAFRLKRHYKL